MGEAWTTSGNCKRPIPSVVEGSGEDVLRVRKNQCLDLGINENIRLVENDPSSKRPHLFTAPISAYWFLNSLPQRCLKEHSELGRKARTFKVACTMPFSPAAVKPEPVPSPQWGEIFNWMRGWSSVFRPNGTLQITWHWGCPLILKSDRKSDRIHPRWLTFPGNRKTEWVWRDNDEKIKLLLADSSFFSKLLHF